VTPLRKARAAAVIGETLWLVGCSYAEPDCVQRTYPILVQGREGTFVWAAIGDPASVNGFSGAPVVNGGGEAVGTLVSAMSVDENREYTHVAFEELRVGLGADAR
jgi:hypothetical protein